MQWSMFVRVHNMSLMSTPSLTALETADLTPDISVNRCMAIVLCCLSHWSAAGTFANIVSVFQHQGQKRITHILETLAGETTCTPTNQRACTAIAASESATFLLQLASPGCRHRSLCQGWHST